MSPGDRAPQGFTRRRVLAYGVGGHASALTGIPVRIASGADDPFHPGVVALANAMPESAVVTITAGCHDDSFFSSQQHPSLAFLARHLTSA
jgi:hypothetical protein